MLLIAADVECLVYYYSIHFSFLRPADLVASAEEHRDGLHRCKSLPRRTERCDGAPQAPTSTTRTY
jgi:hypothetical protein